MNKFIVLTGGPCTGKTAVAQFLVHKRPDLFVSLPEVATLLIKGHFPRFSEESSLCAFQRAVFAVQRQMEASVNAHYSNKIILLDRGTVDGAAYWPRGFDDFFKECGSSLQGEVAHYHRVLLLQNGDRKSFEMHRQNNSARSETFEEAMRLGELTEKLWKSHPRCELVPHTATLLEKGEAVLKLLAGELV